MTDLTGRSEDGLRELRLTPEEHQLLLDELILPGDLESKLRLGLAVGGQVVLRLHEEDLDELLGYIAFAANHADGPALERRLDALYERVLGVLEPMGELSPEVLDLLDEMFPVAVLSPHQQRRLMEDWEGPDAAVRLNPNLALADVEGGELFHNARTIIGAMQDAGKVKATPKGNLNRRFTEEMAAVLRFREGHVADLRRVTKVINEPDVWPLHITRVNLQLARLIKLRTGWFTITKKGAEMLADERAGTLYEHLFRTFFRKFNLGYLDRHPADGAFQYTIGLCLYMVGISLESWIDPAELTSVLVHPLVREGLPELWFGSDPYWFVQARLFRPLEEFGLIERRVVGKRDYYDLEEVRKTPLFDRFLSFDPGPEEPPQFVHPTTRGVN